MFSWFMLFSIWKELRLQLRIRSQTGYAVLQPRAAAAAAAAAAVAAAASEVKLLLLHTNSWGPLLEGQCADAAAVELTHCVQADLYAKREGGREGGCVARRGGERKEYCARRTPKTVRTLYGTARILAGPNQRRIPLLRRIFEGRIPRRFFF